MTTRELILEAWERGGSRTDLEPFPLTATGEDLADIGDTYGTRYWLRQLTSAQRVICSTSYRGKPLRFPDLMIDEYIKLDIKSLPDFNRTTLSLPYVAGLTEDSFAGNVFYWDGLKTVSGNIGVFSLDQIQVTSLGLDDNQILVGEQVTIGGNNYTISSVTGTTVYTIQLTSEVSGVSLSEVVDITFNFTEVNTFILSCSDTGTEYSLIFQDSFVDIPELIDGELRRNNYLFSELGLSDQFRYLLKVTNIDTGTKVKKAERKESFFLTPETSIGSPDYWEQRGGRVYFDVSIDDEVNLRFEELLVPPSVELDVEMFLPDPWHEVILAYVAWKASTRSQENDKAYAMKRDFQELLAQVCDEMSAEYLRDDDYGVYVQFTEEDK